MTSEHLGDFLDRLRMVLLNHASKTPSCSARVEIVQELDERFLDTPCATRLEIKLIQRSKQNHLGRTPICISLEPRILAAAQLQRTHFRPLTVFLLMRRINRFPQQF